MARYTIVFDYGDRHGVTQCVASSPLQGAILCIDPIIGVAVDESDLLDIENDMKEMPPTPMRDCANVWCEHFMDQKGRSSLFYIVQTRTDDNRMVLPEPTSESGMRFFTIIAQGAEVYWISQHISTDIRGALQSWAEVVDNLGWRTTDPVRRELIRRLVESGKFHVDDGWVGLARMDLQLPEEPEDYPVYVIDTDPVGSREFTAVVNSNTKQGYR